IRQLSFDPMRCSCESFHARVKNTGTEHQVWNFANICRKLRESPDSVKTQSGSGCVRAGGGLKPALMRSGQKSSCARTESVLKKSCGGACCCSGGPPACR